jgi:hypothetical protein
MALWLQTKAGQLINTDHVEALRIDTEGGQVALVLGSGTIETIKISKPEKMIEAMKAIADSMASTGQGLFDTSPFE